MSPTPPKTSIHELTKQEAEWCNNLAIELRIAYPEGPAHAMMALATVVAITIASSERGGIPDSVDDALKTFNTNVRRCVDYLKKYGEPVDVNVKRN